MVIELNRLSLIQFVIDTANDLKVNDSRVLKSIISDILRDEFVIESYQQYIESKSTMSHKDYVFATVYDKIKGGA